MAVTSNELECFDQYPLPGERAVSDASDSSGGARRYPSIPLPPMPAAAVRVATAILFPRYDQAARIRVSCRMDGKRMLHMTDYLQTFEEYPEHMLALTLSAPPARAPRGIASVLVEFEEDALTARVQKKAEPVRPALLASKDTVYAAVLLYDILYRREGLGRLSAAVLDERFRTFIDADVERHMKFEPGNEVMPWPAPVAQVPPGTTAAFFKQALNVSDDETGSAWTRTERAFEFLEAEGLAIDPVATSTAMVLMGLVPVRFSVRTPKGERIHKEINVGAALWTLDIKRGTDKGKAFTDVDFRLRNVQSVKAMLLDWARRFIEIEDQQRKKAGRPTAPRSGDPDFEA